MLPFFSEKLRTKSQISRNRRTKRPLPEPYSTDDVLFRDVRDFLGTEYVDNMVDREGEEEWDVPEGLEKFAIVTLRVGGFTVSGGYLFSTHMYPLITVDSP